MFIELKIPFFGCDDELELETVSVNINMIQYIGPYKTYDRDGYEGIKSMVAIGGSTQFYSEYTYEQLVIRIKGLLDDNKPTNNH